VRQPQATAIKLNDQVMSYGELYSRRMRQLFGGGIAQLYSMSWIRPLRPPRHALSVASKHGLPKLLALALAPVGKAADLLAARGEAQHAATRLHSQLTARPKLVYPMR
jgi:hypothetical protein